MDSDMADTLFNETDFALFDVQVSKTPNVILHGHRTRATDKPSLVLLHGFPQTHVIWHKVAPELSKHFSLVIPDIRGYGASSKPASPWKTNPSDHSLCSKKTMAGDISTLMHILGFDRYYVGGHDRGGRITHSLAVNYPQEVLRAVILDISPTLAVYEAFDMIVGGGYWHWSFLTLPAPFPETAINSASEAFGAQMLKGLPTGGVWADKEPGAMFAPQAYAEYVRRLGEAETVHAMCEDYRAGRHEDLDEQRAGGKIKCPVRLLWGNNGLVGKRFKPTEDWAKVCDAGCIDEESVGLDTGHFIPEEAPEETMKHMIDFFRD